MNPDELAEIIRETVNSVAFEMAVQKGMNRLHHDTYTSEERIIEGIKSGFLHLAEKLEDGK